MQLLLVLCWRMYAWNQQCLMVPYIMSLCRILSG